MNNYLTEGDRKRIQRLWAANLSLRQIGQLTGRNKDTIKRCLGEAGFDMSGLTPGFPEGAKRVKIEGASSDWQTGGVE